MKVWCSDSQVRLEWSDGYTRDYYSLWLYDNRPEHRDLHSGQRLVDFADLPEDVAIASASCDADCVEIQWRAGSVSRFPIDWLRDPGRQFEIERHSWTSADAPRLLWSDYRSCDEAAWLMALARDGIAFIRGVTSLEDLIAGVGYIRETNYGRVFDVKNMPDAENLAFTDLGLPGHTDNPYREPVPPMQALHCVQPGSEGGESIFVDGFAVADHLRTTDPTAFEALTRTPVTFWFRSAHVEFSAERRMIELAEPQGIKAIHYNNRSIQVPLLPIAQSAEFYRASKAFSLLLRSPDFTYVVKLDKGDAVVFDNQRILHGRTAYGSAEQPRWLRGCYLDKADLISRLAVLSRQGDGCHTNT
jgi:gamma-butyrobetaine dioxygenase